ncbi:MFS family permease [Nonomuraea muscovyensis]|uniref:MFS family permease n=1 Tax=Nonomuraea muscovyensis TaxID=1124761 RepID=A0A7X0CDA4_9ACTN|nr:MFS transporter [Nonomuraea muscovyensis]MBB6352110.1 MFS family permease [Nonomuraea muscovyensis]
MPIVTTLFIPLALQNFLMAYNTSAMNVALSSIVEDLHTTLTGVQSVISLFALVIAAFLITGSKLGARHGYRWAFVLGARIFLLGTLVTAFGPNLAFMLAGWSLLQGVGVALMLPAMLALLTDALTGSSRTKALTTLGTIGGIGAAAGPLLGGLITHYLSWRVSFLMGAAVTAAVLLLMRRTAEPGPRHAPLEQPFDVPGALLSAAGFGLLVVATLLSGRYGLLRARADVEMFGHTLLHRGGLSPVPLLAGAGLAVLVTFAAWERHLIRSGKDPLVRLSVLRNPTVRNGALTQAMQYLVPTGALFLVPVFVQTTLGFDALRSGLMLLPTTLGLMLAAWAAGRLIAGRRMTHRTAQIWSFLFMTAGCVLIVATFDPYQRGVFATGLAFAPGLLLVGLGEGMATTVTDLIQSAPPPEEVGDVTGLSRSGAYLGSSLGVALAGAFMTTSLLYLFEAGTDGSTVLPPEQKQLVKETLENHVQITAASDDAVRARLHSQGLPGASADELVRINARAREHALAVAVTSMAVLSAGGLLAARRLPQARASRHG